MASRFRLLISARDPGAANNLAPIARLAQASPDIDLHLVASHPADRIFTAWGLNPEPVEHDERALPLVAAQLLQCHQPDAVLVGLSGPGRGIDEALLAAAEKRVPTWALQDFWGDVNNGFGAYADTYLVRDASAARITRERAPIATRVTGLPGNATPPPAWKQRCMAHALRQGHRLAPNTPLMVLCSQPLWQQPGYRDTLRELFRNLPGGRLLVRMHPRETERDRWQMRKLLQRHCRQDWTFSDDQFDALLCASDLLLSPFSNCGLDKALFNSRSGGHGGTPVFLLQNPQLKRLYRKWTGLQTHPLSEQGASTTVTRHGTLKRKLAEALCPSGQAPLLRAARGLGGSAQSALVILGLIRSGATLPAHGSRAAIPVDARQAS